MTWANSSVTVTRMLQTKSKVDLLSSFREEDYCWCMTTEAGASPFDTNSSPWTFGFGELKIIQSQNSDNMHHGTWWQSFCESLNKVWTKSFEKCRRSRPQKKLFTPAHLSADIPHSNNQFFPLENQVNKGLYFCCKRLRTLYSNVHNTWKCILS
jgi:hypothetical protein